MKIILKQKVDKLGKPNEIKDVKSGYARNFLVPQGLAVLATKEKIEQLKEEKRQQKKQFKGLEDELQNMQIDIKAKIGPKEKMFGSVTAQDVADKINKQIENQIEKEQIQLERPIKDLGGYDIEIKIAENLTAKIRLKVTAEKLL